MGRGNAEIQQLVRQSQELEKRAGALNRENAALKAQLAEQARERSEHDARVRREALEEAARIVHKTGHANFTGMCRPVCLTCTMLNQLETSIAAFAPAPQVCHDGSQRKPEAGLGEEGYTSGKAG